MKKVFALLMALALLIPMCLVPGSAESVAVKPFYGVGWSDLNEDKFPYVDGLVTMNIGVSGGNITLSYSGAKINSGKIDETQLDKMVQALKKEMDSRPEGMRFIHFFGPAKALGASPQNVIYLDYGVDRLKELTTALFEKYKEAGGKVEGAVMSTLYSGMGSWYIKSEDAKKDPLIYNKIVQDPHYATEVRPLLEERGFRFYETPSEYTPEIYGITGNAGSAYSNCAAIWDTVMRIRLNNYMTEWCYEPMAKYFPDVYCSDYQSADNDTWLKGVNNDGDRLGAGGNSLGAGNTSCQNFYSGRPTADFYKDGNPVFKNIPTYNEAVYEKSPYNCFMYDMNVAKRVYLSDNSGNVCYWISRYDGDADDPDSITNTPYYAEQAFHLNLLDPKPFVVFLYSGYFDNQEDFDRCTNVVNELLEELTRVAGYADRKPIALPQNWNSEFVLSGMYANGRNIWRITPNIDEVSKEDFKVEGADPTFRVKGQTITFPGGKIIEDATISHIGTCGYWVETPADVTPIVTNDADRFEKFPVYTEDFESYAPETKLVAMNIRDDGAWIIQPKGNDLVVTAQGDNKVLAITGNSLMQNKLIPANVTAADSYAKNQSWEITVTIPETEGELILLNYEANKTPCKDGGIKIADQKLYYSTFTLNEEGKAVQEYQYLCDLTPGTYTFKRVMDFSDPENFYCTYICTNASEGLETKTLPIPTFTGTVTSIGITCKNVTGTVLLDDYKLKLTGAAADLAVYEAAFGMELTEEEWETPRDSATAYHLSWMNATAREETATVVAEFYEGDTLVEEKILHDVKMVPGADGVEFGVVELREGQTVKVYLKTTVNAESDGQNQGNDGAKKGGISTVLGSIIAVVAVVLVAFLLLPNPKQKIPKAPTTRL